MARFAAVDDVGFRHVNLLDLGIPLFGLSLQTFDLSRREINHVLGNVLVYFCLGFSDRFQEIGEFGAQLGAFGLEVVVSFLELVEVVLLFCAIGVFDGSQFILELLEIILLALLAGCAAVRLDLVSYSINVCTTIGKNALHGKNLGAEIAEVFLNFLSTRPRLLIRLLPGLFELLVLGILSHILFGRGRLRFCGLKERAVTVLPLLLESLPGSLAESLIPQGPEERRDEDDRRDQIVQRVRLAYERVILGDWFLGHHILPFNVARRYWLCSHLEKMSEMSSQRVYPPGICFLPAM